ncbi:MAG: AAA family ATPase [Blastocatellia bacterium]|nr:AAA family ATPase [Blastocatellia bacterium]
MRIQRISVKNLFGVFNHVIPLNTDERITIIHGPNGFGKTIMLKMLDGFFNARYADWRTTPFDEFRIDFTDGSWVNILPDTKIPQYIDVDFHQTAADQAIPARILLEQLPEESSFDDYPIVDVSVPKERFESRGNFLSKRASVQQSRDLEPQWLRDLKKSVNVHFVRTDRLLKMKGRDQDRTVAQPLPGYRAKLEWSVDRYAKQLTDTIQVALAEYGEFSQTLDRTFPRRIIEEPTSPTFSSQELQQKLRSLEEKREKLRSLGLLDDDQNEGALPPLEVKDTHAINVLTIYVKDTEEKLGALQDLAERIDIFTRIVNKRFLYKQMKVSREKGFFFSTLEGSPLQAHQLSSGEQHELILLYELLFKATPDSLFLIDEPELSLHVGWQQQFLRDLQEITRISRIDVLIATHSPSIIHDRWDLTVELKGPLQ